MIEHSDSSAYFVSNIYLKITTSMLFSSTFCFYFICCKATVLTEFNYQTLTDKIIIAQNYKDFFFNNLLKHCFQGNLISLSELLRFTANELNIHALTVRNR